jgi:hypothetical protein
MYKYGVIGFGIAGQLLVLELIQRGIKPKDIVILDETFLGGALITTYGSVLSNTPWWKTRKALAEYQPWATEAITEGDSQFQENQCMSVRSIARLCYMAASKAATQIEKLTTTVNKTEPSSDCWSLYHTFGSVKVSTLFLCSGSLEKTLELSMPVIPLSIALDKTQLSNVVSSGDHIVLFGTAHSGTIILNHLQELGVPVSAIHKTSKPFLFERDGDYDGLKEESARIADEIIEGRYSNTTILPWSNPLQVHKSLIKATKAIVSVGFYAKPIGGLNLAYSPATAALTSYTNCYGYGIAFPGTTDLNDRTYADVSVLSFQEQIRRTLPHILQS